MAFPTVRRSLSLLVFLAIGNSLGAALWLARGAPLGTWIRWPENALIAGFVILGLHRNHKLVARNDDSRVAMVTWLLYVPIVAAAFLALLVAGDAQRGEAGVAIVAQALVMTFGAWPLTGPDAPFEFAGPVWLVTTLAALAACSALASLLRARRA